MMRIVIRWSFSMGCRRLRIPRLWWFRSCLRWHHLGCCPWVCRWCCRVIWLIVWSLGIECNWWGFTSWLLVWRRNRKGYLGHISFVCQSSRWTQYLNHRASQWRQISRNKKSTVYSAVQLHHPYGDMRY